MEVSGLMRNLIQLRGRHGAHRGTPVRWFHARENVAEIVLLAPLELRVTAPEVFINQIAKFGTLARLAHAMYGASGHPATFETPKNAAVIAPAAPLPLDQIEVKSYVGGLVKSFERKAA